MAADIKFPAEAVVAMVRGERLQAIKLVREANPGMDLIGAMQAVDAHDLGRKYLHEESGLQAHDVTHAGLPEAAVDAIARGQLIQAIKIVRQTKGLGLKEAKDLVDQHREEASAASMSRIGGQSSARATSSVVGGARTTSTISADSKRFGWLWPLFAVICFAAAWLLLGR